MKKFYVYFIIILSLLFLTSCDDKNNKTVNQDEFSQINYIVENDKPDYGFIAEIKDSNGVLLNKNDVISYEGDNLNFTIDIEFSTNKLNVMKIMVLIDGIMAEMQFDDGTNDFYKDLLFEKSMKQTISFSINPIIKTSGKKKLSFLFITEQNTNIIDIIEPVKNYTSVFNLVLNVEKYKETDIISSVSNDYKTENFTDYFDEDTIKKYDEYFGNSINTIFCRKDKQFGFYQPIKLYQNTEKELDIPYNIKITGKKGRYATIVFVNNEPCPAFNGKYHLVWSIDNNEIMVTTITLPISNYKNNLVIYSITIPLDFTTDQIYDSVKVNLIISDQESRTENSSEKRTKTQILDAKGIVINPNIVYDYKGGNIEFTYIYKQVFYDVDENIKLMVLVNGIPVPFSIEDKKEELYYDFSISPSQSKSFKITLYPLFDKNLELFNIEIVAISECEKIYYNECARDNYKICNRIRVLYKIDDNSENNIKSYSNYYTENVSKSYGLTNNENDTVVNTSSKTFLLYTDENKDKILYSTQYVQIEKNDDLNIYFESYNLVKGEYISFAILNGECINIFNNKKFSHWVISDDNDFIKFTLNIPKEKIKEKNSLIIITTKINYEVITYDECNYIYTNNIRLNFVVNIKNESNIINNINLIKDNEANQILTEFRNQIGKYVIYSYSIKSGLNEYKDYNKTIRYNTNNIFECNNELYHIETGINNATINNILINYYNDGKLYTEKYNTYIENMHLIESE